MADRCYKCGRELLSTADFDGLCVYCRYEPSIPSPSPEPACPVCGHPVSEHRDGRSGYKGCYHNRRNNVPLYCKCECSPKEIMQAIATSQPKYEGQMPLIEAPLTENYWHDEGFIMGRNTQRDADWQWHLADKAEAIKQFKERLIREISKKKTYGGNEQSTSFNRGLRIASEIIRAEKEAAAPKGDGFMETLNLEDTDENTRN